jgi:hypothetical protein
MVFGQNCSPGFCIVKIDSELFRQRGVSLVKQRGYHAQQRLVPEL